MQALKQFGSGWAWLCVNNVTGGLVISTTQNQGVVERGCCMLAMLAMLAMPRVCLVTSLPLLLSNTSQ